MLDGYIEHLTSRTAAGITDAVALQRLAFTGSAQTVRRYLRSLRATAPTTGIQRTARAVPSRDRLPHGLRKAKRLLD